MTDKTRKTRIAPAVAFVVSFIAALFTMWLSGLDFERGMAQAFWFAGAIVMSSLVAKIFAFEP